MPLTVQFPVLLLLAVSDPSFAVRTMQGTEAQALANPIRKVVNMLQSMQKKVTEEGEKEKELYEKFMCYCKNGGGDLQASISAAETKVPAVSSDIEASEQKLEQSKADLKQGQSDRSTAKTTMAEAKAIREKEAAAFAADKAEYDDTISAINQAVAALEKGMAGSFLQTHGAQVLKQLALGKQDMLDADRQELMSFLSAGQGSDYAPQSGQITGILKEMGDTMAKSLADITATETTAIKTYEELTAAKTKEVAALTSSIESNTNKIGDLGVAIVQLKEDLSDTETALMEDKKFLADLEKSCSTKTAEWEERSTTRAEELVALAETIKVLNDDDALELFKKTLPSASSASLLQMGVDLKEVRTRALTALREARGADGSKKPGLEILMLALSGNKAMSKGTFDKVIKMVDDMVELLKQEQTDDDHKKEYCITQLDLGDDKKKSLERTVADKENAIAAAEEGIKSLADEIAALEAGIKALDKQVAEATEQRKSEHSEFQELMATTSAAKELLGFAKNRLNKFYNPKLYVAPPKQELSEQDRIVVNMGGTPPPTPAPGGIAGTGIAALAEVSENRRQGTAVEASAPPPPPETWDAYAKKSQESTGVIAMIDLLIKDLSKELTESETSEKDAQADYESAMQDSAEKRTMDSKSLGDKLSAKADLEASLETHKGDKSAAGKELMATMKYIQSLHSECDWLMQYFDVRKEARAGEVESLKNAKAILSGADLSLLQERTRVLRGAQ